MKGLSPCAADDPKAEGERGEGERGEGGAGAAGSIVSGYTGNMSRRALGHMRIYIFTYTCNTCMRRHL